MCTRRWPSPCSWRRSTCGSGDGNNRPRHAPAPTDPALSVRPGVPPAGTVIACRPRVARPESGGPTEESSMPHVRRAALPLLVVALGATLAACSRNEQAADAAATPAAAPETTQAAVPASEDVHPFQIGSLQAAALRDGGMSVPNDNSVFGVGLTPSAVAGVPAAAGLETGQLHLSVQPLLVRDGERVYLLDTGAGGNMGDSAGKLGAALQAAGVDPAQVTDVFISHAHGDHVGGLVDAAGALAFPNAAIHISQPEWEDLQAQASGEGAAMAGLVAAI